MIEHAKFGIFLNKIVNKLVLMKVKRQTNNWSVVLFVLYLYLIMSYVSVRVAAVLVKSPYWKQNSFFFFKFSKKINIFLSNIGYHNFSLLKVKNILFSNQKQSKKIHKMKVGDLRILPFIHEADYG